MIANEEATFLATLNRGLTLLNNVFSQPDLQVKKMIPAQVAFQLFDTFGFPFDLTLIIAQERGWSIDMKGLWIHEKGSPLDQCAHDGHV